MATVVISPLPSNEIEEILSLNGVSSVAYAKCSCYDWLNNAGLEWVVVADKTSKTLVDVLEKLVPDGIAFSEFSPPDEIE
jgi:hypothetical protein